MTRDPMDTFARYGREADRRVRESRPDASRLAAAWTPMVAGLAAALLECDEHPGVLRRPLDPAWDRLRCPVDGQEWHAKPASEPIGGMGDETTAATS